MTSLGRLIGAHLSGTWDIAAQQVGGPGLDPLRARKDTAARNRTLTEILIGRHINRLQQASTPELTPKQSDGRQRHSAYSAYSDVCATDAPLAFHEVLLLTPGAMRQEAADVYLEGLLRMQKGQV